MVNSEMYSIIFPARIVEFFPETQTANVLICAERSTNNSELISEPVLRAAIEEVPVHMPQGGGWALTLPVVVGDTCMVCFSQVGYDHWFYKDADTAGTLAASPKPHLKRKFSEDDGFCFVGFNPLPRVIQEYSTGNLELRNRDRKQVMSLDANGDINILSDTNVNVTATTKVTITAPNVEVIATTKILLTTPLVECSKDLKVLGKIDATGKISSDDDCVGGGISLKGHTHTTTATVGPSAALGTISTPA